jgi:stage II sporulation protein D
MFRDATGEPGWVAASTRRERIRIEPPDVFRGRLENVLRHEFLHMLVEGEAKADTPLWFREGLVLYLGGEARERPGVQLTPDQISQVIQSRRSQAEVQNAYNAAAGLVSQLDRQWGRAALMRWLRDGIPGGAVRREFYNK